MKRVLIVAGEFPPVKSIGRLRSIKFCQHLPRLGWEPLVLTVDPSAAHACDPDTLQEIPQHVRVFRARDPAPLDQSIHRVKSRLRRGPRGPASSPAGPAARAAGSAAGDGAKPSLIGRFTGALDRFGTRYVLIPDDWVLWARPAVKLGAEVCRSHPVDLIFATAPPFTDLLIGHRLHRATGIPWIADYRDLWTGDVLRDWVPGWRRHLEIRMERRTLSTASGVLSVSEPKTEFLRGRLPFLRPERLVTVTNGYDLEEYAGLAPYRPAGDEHVRFVYTGRLFKNRRGYELVEAAGQLKAERPDVGARIRIEYYGGIAPPIREHLDHVADAFGLHDALHYFPDVPYHRAKEVQLGADVLFLIVDTGETTAGVIPGKLFEYIAANRPILCIAEPGATSEFIERGRLGWTVRAGDVTGLRQLLGRILSAPGRPHHSPDSAYLGRFERRKLVERVASFFDECAGRPKP